jgi:hypothetical protein
MPEPTPVVAAPAPGPTKAPEQVVTDPTLSPAQPVATEAEKEARKVARLANARRQFERLETERGKFASEQMTWREQSAQALRDAGALRELRRLAAEDPVKALEAMGHKFEDVLKKTATRGAVTPETIEQQVTQRVQAELSKFKAQMDEASRVASLKQQESMRENQINATKKMMEDLVKSTPDKYEFVDSDEARDAAFELMVKTYEKTMDPKTGKGGHMMTIGEALDKLEEAYLNQHLARSEKSSKVKAALEAKAAKAKEEADKAAAEASAKAAPAKRSKWQSSRSETVAKEAPLTAASQAPNHSESRRLNISEKIQKNLDAYRAARANNDA